MEIDQDKVNREKMSLLLQYPSIKEVWRAFRDRRINRRSKFRKRAFEEIISEDLNYSYYYVRYYTKQRFELGEPAIATSADHAFLYANIIGARFELGEHVIATKSYRSYQYAKNVLKGRFELGEPAIAENDYYSYLYARNVLKGRFELGEPVLRYSGYWPTYKRMVGINDDSEYQQ